MEQPSSFQRDPWHDLVNSWLIGRHRVTVDQIADALGMPNADEIVSRRIGRIMSALGWRHTRLGWLKKASRVEASS